jgi:CTP:molybdopterin cytidylyltransferase MocA
MVAGVILAGGASSRMGRAKAALPCGDGRSFLSHVVATLAAAGIHPIVVVAGFHVREVREAARLESLPVEVVVNAQPERGQLSSLVTGLNALSVPPVRAAAVTPVDQPLVRVATVAALVEAYRRSHALIVRPEHAGRHGHPVILDARLFEELRAADAGAGARAVIARHASETRDVPLADPGAFEDIDTPEDYRRLVGRLP